MHMAAASAPRVASPSGAACARLAQTLSPKAVRTLDVLFTSIPSFDTTVLAIYYFALSEEAIFDEDQERSSNLNFMVRGLGRRCIFRFFRLLFVTRIRCTVTFQHS